MRHKPFLYSVAEAYAENEGDSLMDYCFVFPNKRSATLFTDYLESIARERMQRSQFIPPCTTTIVEFTESFCQSFQIERMEAVFMLFDIYRGVLRRRRGDSEADSLDFNRFVYWADLLINDFDDVDNALVDPDEIFKNVEALKEISANYLTPEQIEIIRQYWADDRVPQDVQQFWNHIAHPAGDHEANASVGFLKLWQVMKDVYRGFRGRLRDEDMHTSGMAARIAAERVRDMAPSDFEFRRYIFVGFNNLSKAERSIMGRIGELVDKESGMPMGDFYWDLASPVLRDAKALVGAQVRSYARIFRSLYDCIPSVEGFPEIDVTGVPSRVAQAKLIGAILDRSFAPEGEGADGNPAPTREQERLRRTAVILPDENLLTPLINSIPAHVSPLNITMGYKLRNTAVAGLIRDIVAMQMRAYRSRKEETFFYEDVNKVLSNPLVRLTHPVAAMRALEEIQQKRLFNVPEAMFTAEEYRGMAPVFEMVVNKKNIDQVTGYIERLLDWAENTVRLFSGQPMETEREEPDEESETVGEGTSIDGGDGAAAIQIAFIRRYRNAVWHIRRLMLNYLGESRMAVEDNTLFNLIERLTAGEMLNFDGMPLKGLQIMGILEARSLDFDTLILPSMNERIFPRGKFNGSFIPMVLRRAYGLPTSETQENAFAYFFYRMISRARKVIVLYDARTSGTKSSQMSRYIHQLKYLYKPAGLKLNVIPFRLVSPEMPTLQVVKTPEVMAELNKFLTPGSGRRLSASSIKKYMACPLSFYLEHIANFREDDEMRDWIDESTYGTIVHEVFEKMYERCKTAHGSAGGVTVTAEMLDGMIQDSATLGREIVRSIKRNYLKCDEEDPAPLIGEAKMYAFFISEIVRKVFQREKAMAPFEYLHGEWQQPGKEMPLTLTGSGDSRFTFNFTARIDRVDRYAGPDGYERLRIIDYKTGSDKLVAPDMHAVLHNYDTKAFLQLMLYCQAYAQSKGYDGPIQPMIYSTKALMIREIEPLKISAPRMGDDVENAELKRPKGNRRDAKWNLLDYRDYVTEFNDLLIEELRRLFDPSVPFTRTEDETDCTYCQFKDLCQSKKQL